MQNRHAQESAAVAAPPPGLARALGAFLLALIVLAVGSDARAEDAPKKKAPAKPAAAKPAAKGEALPEEVEEPAGPPFEFIDEFKIRDLENDLITYFYQTNFAKPADLKTSLGLMGFGVKNGIEVGLEPVPAQNQLLIKGPLDLVQAVLGAIEYFDVRAPQVFIEAQVIEITYDSNFEFGLDWNWDRSQQGPASTLFRGSGGTLNPPSFLRSALPPGFPFQGTGAVFGLTGSNADKFGALDVRYQALLINGKAEVLSQPSVIVTQGVPAKITTSEQIPIASLQRADNNNTTFQLNNVNAGVRLTVDAKHIGREYVTLKVQPAVDGIQQNAATRTGGTFTPITTKRSAETQVTLRDGETLVIGGLFTNNQVREKAKTPFLSDLPLVGELFTRTRETKSKTELVFILTPHIIGKTGSTRIIKPPSELKRLEQQKRSADEGEGCKGPRIFRKPGAYLDEFEDD